MSARWRSNKGNSLAEVMVCLVIVAIVATANTKGMVFTTELVGESTLQQEAVVLAQKSVERLRTSSYNAVASASTLAAGGRYTIVQVVSTDTPETGMKQINVTVNWTWKGQARSYALTTIFAKLTKS